MAQLEDYSYLWDASDPGWVVLSIQRQIAELALTFPSRGPSVQDVAAVRAVIPMFADKTAAQAYEALSGLERVPLGTYEYREAKRLSDSCARKGLSFDLMAIDSPELLPYHEGRRMGLIIEESSLAAAVCEAAIARGLRVIQVEA